MKRTKAELPGLAYSRRGDELRIDLYLGSSLEEDEGLSPNVEPGPPW